MTQPKPNIGKGNSLLYALIVALFLSWQSVEISRTREDGWTFKSKSVNVEILTSCLVFMGVALGINLGEALTSIALAVSRNSMAINALLNKNKISPTTLEPTEEEDKNDGSKL